MHTTHHGAQEPPLRSTQTLFTSCVTLKDEDAKGAGRSISIMSEDPHTTLSVLLKEAETTLKHPMSKKKVLKKGKTSNASKSPKSSRLSPTLDKDSTISMTKYDSSQRNKIVTNQYKKILTRRAFRGGDSAKIQPNELAKPRVYVRKAKKVRSEAQIAEDRRKKKLEEEYWMNYELPGDIRPLQTRELEKGMRGKVWINSPMMKDTNVYTKLNSNVSLEAINKTRSIVEKDVSMLRSPPSKMNEINTKEGEIADVLLTKDDSPDLTWLRPQGDYGRVGTSKFEEELHVQGWLERLVTERAASKGDPSAQALLAEMELEKNKERVHPADDEEIEGEAALGEKFLQGVVKSYTQSELE